MPHSWFYVVGNALLVGLPLAHVALVFSEGFIINDMKAAVYA